MDQLLNMTGGATAGHIVSTTANVLYILDVVRAIAHFWLWCTLALLGEIASFGPALIHTLYVLCAV